MKTLLLVLFITLCSTSIYSQVSTVLKHQELLQDNFSISTPIQDFPIDQLPDTSYQAFLASKYEGITYTVYLLFTTNETTYIKSSSLEIEEEEFYACSAPHVHYMDGILELECRWMRGITFLTQIKLHDNQLIYHNNIMYDINEEINTKIKKAQLEDDPVTYCKAQHEVQFHDMYEERLAESLIWAHDKALKAYKNKDYQTASAIMDSLRICCNLTLDLDETYISTTELITIWSDASLFFVRANNNKACISLANFFLEKNPQATGMYLQYGDALFNLGKKKAAEKVYHIYAKQMTDKGNSNRIPSRVKNRK